MFNSDSVDDTELESFSNAYDPDGLSNLDLQTLVYDPDSAGNRVIRQIPQRCVGSTQRVFDTDIESHSDVYDPGSVGDTYLESFGDIYDPENLKGSIQTLWAMCMTHTSWAIQTFSPSMICTTHRVLSMGLESRSDVYDSGGVGNTDLSPTVTCMTQRVKISQAWFPH